MAAISVRPALLDDTQAICALFRSRIATWQRLDEQGRVEDKSYDALTIYERWLHGGPWMSVETGALQISHLLRGAGLPLVAEYDGHVLAYTEAYHGVEPAPFGDHLHVAPVTVHRDYADSALADALLDNLHERARTFRCQRLTASCALSDQEASAFYRRHGLNVIKTLRRYSLSARMGQVFYKAVEHLSANPTQIADWQMPVGRLTSARQQWETLWPRTWYAVPELRQQHAHRLHFSVAGQEAFAYCQQQLYAPRNVDVYQWSPKPLTGQMLAALRDWAHREGYRTLVMVVGDEAVPVLGAEAEPDGFEQAIYAVDV